MGHPWGRCDKCGVEKVCITDFGKDPLEWVLYWVCPNCDLDAELSRLLSEYAEMRERRCEHCDEGDEGASCTCRDDVWEWNCIEEQMGQLEALRPSRGGEEGGVPG